MQSEELHYFSAANTARGFQSFYDETFRDIQHLVILKGGPGTGKSSLMRSALLHASGQGLRAELIHCSSDPDSLDAVLFPQTGLAIADGTAPHEITPRYPGLREELFDLGAFWDQNKLVSHAQEIQKLSDRKALLYRDTYRYLSAAWEQQMLIWENVRRRVREEKLQEAALRLADLLCDGQCGGLDGKRRLVMTDAIGMSGRVHLETFENASRCRIGIRDRWEAAPLLIHLIEEELLRRGAEVWVSGNLLDPSRKTGLFLPKTRSCVSILPSRTPRHGDRYSYDQTIRTDRFLNLAELRGTSLALQYAARCREMLMEGAEQTLRQIRETHFRLEEIYGEAMDFEAKEEAGENLLRRLFS